MKHLTKRFHAMAFAAIALSCLAGCATMSNYDSAVVLPEGVGVAGAAVDGCGVPADASGTLGLAITGEAFLKASLRGEGIPAELSFRAYPLGFGVGYKLAFVELGPLYLSGAALMDLFVAESSSSGSGTSEGKGVFDVSTRLLLTLRPSSWLELTLSPSCIARLSAADIGLPGGETFGFFYGGNANLKIGDGLGIIVQAGYFRDLKDRSWFSGGIAFFVGGGSSSEAAPQ